MKDKHCNANYALSSVTNGMTIYKKMSLAGLVVYSISVTANTVNAPGLPDMKMHIYQQPKTDSSSSVTSVPVENITMNMVIFSNDSPQESPADPIEENGETLNFSYADDQVDIYTEEPADPEYNKNDELPIDVELYVDSGYRVEEFSWNKAHPSGTPNILSELSWDDIEIVDVEIGTAVKTPGNWIFSGKVAYGEIMEGDNQDSDYYGDNRTQEFSRSNNRSDSGNTLDGSFSMGYQVDLIPSVYRKPYLSLTPKLGFSYHSLNLKIKDGFQTIPATGSFSGLDSDYDAVWYGPWAGFNSQVSFADWVSFSAALEYHYTYYEGTGNWNLRESFAHPKSFVQKSEGTGLVTSLGSQIKLIDDLSLNLSVDYRKWRVDKNGKDKIFFADGSTAEMKFNEVERESVGARIGINYAF